MLVYCHDCMTRVLGAAEDLPQMALSPCIGVFTSFRVGSSMPCSLVCACVFAWACVWEAAVGGLV